MLATVTVNVNCAGIPVSWLTKVFNQIQVRDSLLCLPLLKQSFRMLSRKKEERKKHTHKKTKVWKILNCYLRTSYCLGIIIPTFKILCKIYISNELIARK